MSEQPQYPRCSEQNGCDSEGDFFPLLLLLSSYLQLLEVLLLHLLLCYHVRLVLNLVDLLRSAVRLNLRHYPGDRRLESRGHNLRGGGASALPPVSLWAETKKPSSGSRSRAASRAASQPACLQPYFAWLAGQCRLWELRRTEWRLMTEPRCYSLRLWFNIAEERKERKKTSAGDKCQKTSKRNNGRRLSFFFK